MGGDFGEDEKEDCGLILGVVDWCLIVDFGSEAISIRSMGIELWLEWGNQAWNSLDERINQNTNKWRETEPIHTTVHSQGGSLCRLNGWDVIELSLKWLLINVGILLKIWG